MNGSALHERRRQTPPVFVRLTVNRVANDRPARLEPIAQSPTPAGFTPAMPATAEAQTSAPAKRAKKPKKDERQTSLF
jgi:hypothetical protein